MAKPKEEVDKEHGELLESWKKQWDEREAKKKAWAEWKAAKEEEEKKKQEELDEESKAKKKEQI